MKFAIFIVSVLGLLWAVTNKFEKKKNRDWLLNLLRTISAKQRYRSSLRALLVRVDRFYRAKEGKGTQGYGWRVYFRCLYIAFLYPILLFLLSWCLGSDGSLGNFQLLDAEIGLVGRCLIALIVVFLGYFYYWFSSRTISYVIARVIIQKLKIRLKLMPAIVGFVVPVSVCAIAFTAANFFPVANVFAAATFFIATIVFGVATFCAFGAALDYARIGSFTHFVTAIAIVTFLYFAGVGSFGIFLENVERFILFLTFFFCLPLANSVLDFISLKLTRKLAGSWIESDQVKSWKFVVSGLFVDLALAVGCLVLLALFIPLVLEVINFLIGVFLPEEKVFVIDWLPYAEKAVVDPLGEGIMVTMMLVTTLIPTLVHMVVGAFGAGVHLSLLPKRIVMSVLDMPDEKFTLFGQSVICGFFLSLLAPILFLVSRLGLGMFIIYWWFSGYQFGESLLAIAQWVHAWFH